MTDQFKKKVKKLVASMGIDLREVVQGIARRSIRRAVREEDLVEMIKRLRMLVPDISQQESHMDVYNDYWELKRRAMHAFQCRLMLEAIKDNRAVKISVCDIGDSAGTHMFYLRELTKGSREIDTISVNLDPRAIDKIRAKGYKAILCRAEDLELQGMPVDLFTSFQMVEHLHNPALFFRRLAVKSSCERMVITVPFMRNSRVGLHHVRARSVDKIEAEQEHIFELSPEDWTLLFLHSGWDVVSSRVYYQYPRKCPVVSALLRWFWKNTDYEGFWGAILKRNTEISDAYKDWKL